MTKVIERATSHFRDKLSAGMNSIAVPEWDCRVYFKGTVTLKEQSRIIELATQGKSVDALIETLIVKARNEDGTRMFSPADRVVLMNEVDPNVVMRVVTEINNLSNEEADLAAVEKN